MLSPEEIRARTFLVSLRGYDREEVATFLEQVAGELALLQERLATAEGAAQDLPTAADIVAEAEGDRAPADADEPRPFAEIGQETQRILEAAQAAGEELRDRAREDADRELKAARAQATKVLADAERRRDEIEASVRALEEAREGLAGDLRGVGRTIERLLRDLVPAQQATTTIRAALAEAAREQGSDVAARDAADRADDAEADTEPDDGTGAAEAEASARPASTDAAADATAEVEPSAAPTGETDNEPAARAEGAEQPANGEPPAASGRPARLVVVPELDADVAAGPTADDADAAAAAPPTSPPRSSWTLPERVPVQARGEALAPSHPKLVRRLKRGLQDLENATLERLRGAGDTPDVEALLPEETAAEDLGELAHTHIANAYAVGYHSGASAIGQGAGDPPELTHDIAGQLAGEVVTAVAEALRARLSTDVASGDREALAAAVDDAFAGIRDGFVREASAVALIRAYEWGQHDAWVTAGIEGRKWALATEPECGDPRCEDNAGSGAVPLDEPFPSGHEVPPVRAGCSCTTVPLVPRS